MLIKIEYEGYTFQEVEELLKQAKTKEAKLAWFGYLLCMVHCDIISIKQHDVLVDILNIPVGELEKMNFE